MRGYGIAGDLGMRTLLAGCFAVALGGIASAQQHFDAQGFGLSSCAEYAADYRRSPEALETIYFTWAQGFISGVNADRANDFFDLKAKTPHEMRRLIRQYCNAHPLANYREAVLELMKSLPVVKYKE